ncbi:MAG: hypothetical protein AAFY45_22460 [Bacteroidota bacterium]
MPNSRRKIWDLYDLLSEKEVNVCQAWITANVGGKDAMVSKLFRAMQRDREDKLIWKKLYGTEVYNDNRLRNLFHELGKYLEDYIAFQQFRKAPFLRDLYLIKGINRRGLAESFRYFFRKVKQRWERQPIRNSRYYWALYELEGENFHHASKFPRKEKLDYFRDVEGNLERALNLELLRGSLFSYVSNKNQEIRNPKGILGEKSFELIEASNFQDVHLIPLYSKLYAFTKGEVKDSGLIINEIKVIWEKNISTDAEFSLAGSKDEFLNLAFILLNKLIEIQNEEPSFENRSLVFNFYVWLIDLELLNFDGYLPVIHYRNVITQGLQIKKWEEVDELIDKFSILLSPQIRKIAKDYARGAYLFLTKEYRKSIRLLNQNFYYFMEDLAARFYIIQAHYELGNFDDLKYRLSLLKAYIKRNKEIDKLRAKLYLKKVQYFQRLCDSNKLIEFENLKQSIQENNDAASPDWLIEKCEENIAWLSLNKA